MKKSFSDLILTVDRGQLSRDIGDAMDKIIEGVLTHRGPGQISVTLKIKPKGDAFEISGDMEHKVPKRQRLGAIRFYDPESGELTTRDPNQPDLPGTNIEQLDKTRQGEVS